MNFISSVIALLFYFRKPVVSSLKPLEIVFPLIIGALILSRSVLVGRGTVIIFAFLVYAALHSMIYVLITGSDLPLPDVARYALSIFSALFLFNFFVISRSDPRKFFYLFSTAGVLVSFLSLAAFITKGSGFLEYFLSGSGAEWKTDRVSGLDYNPNYFSIYLLLVSSVVLSAVVQEFRVFWLFSALVVLLAIFSTLSRTALLALLVQIFFVIHFSRWRPFIKVGIFLSMMLVIGVFFVYAGYAEDFLMRIQASSSRSGGEIRFEIWRASIASFLDSPVLGHGLGSSASSIQSITGMYLTAHNEYLSLAMELGLVGLFIFIFFHFYIIISLYKMRQFFFRFEVLSVFIFFLSMCVFFVGNTVSTSRIYWLAVAMFWIVKSRYAMVQFFRHRMSDNVYGAV